MVNRKHMKYQRVVVHQEAELETLNKEEVRHGMRTVCCVKSSVCLLLRRTNLQDAHVLSEAHRDD